MATNCPEIGVGADHFSRSARKPPHPPAGDNGPQQPAENIASSSPKAARAAQPGCLLELTCPPCPWWTGRRDQRCERGAPRGWLGDEQKLVGASVLPRNQAVDLLGDAAEVVADLLQQVFTLREQLPNLTATVDGGAFHFHQPSFAESFHQAAHQGRRDADGRRQVLLCPAGVVGAGVAEPENQTFGPIRPRGWTCSSSKLRRRRNVPPAA